MGEEKNRSKSVVPDLGQFLMLLSVSSKRWRDVIDCCVWIVFNIAWIGVYVVFEREFWS